MDINFNSGKVFCTKCGTANKAGYRFCVKCGTKLVTFVPKPQVEDEPDIPKIEPAKTELQQEQPTFSVFEETAPVEEPAKAEPEQSTFSAFEQNAPVEEPVKVRQEPEMPELQPTFSAFEQAASVEEPVKARQEPEMLELQPTFSAFEQAAPVEEPVKVESQPEEPTFSAFEQTAPQEEPVKTAGVAGNGQAAFEAKPEKEYAGFARSGFTGTTTPTAAAGAFAAAVDAVKNNKQIDISDAETVMSLLEQGEPSALAKGLPAWDIVPPQVVVRRKHRV
ncbi:MAG: zinc-ribbon domain-containing protein [Lachnospiraceae bacterium]|nr:zinc-ribbon domain-containing protein [Lachnospiraceae bacterium]